jgi:hypothetical protein
MNSKDIMDEQEIDEAAPMGIGSRLWAGVKSKLGGSQTSAQSKGQLATGKIANDIMVQYKHYLGSTGKPSTAETLLYFLSQKGYPITDAQNVLSGAQSSPATADTAPVNPQPTPKTEPSLSENKITSAEAMRNLLQLLNEAAGEIDDNLVSQAVLAAAREYTTSSYFGAGSAPQSSTASYSAQTQPRAQSTSAAQPATQEPKTTAAATNTDPAPMSPDGVTAQIQKLWNNWVETGKNATPEMKQLIKRMWKDAGGVTATESKKRPIKKIA